MPGARQDRWPLRAGCLLVAIATLGAWVLGGTSFVRFLDLKTYDLLTKLRPAPGNPPVAIVAIDEKTRTQIREPMIFWHRHYARVLKALQASGARAIGVDVVFALPMDEWLPGADQQLAAAYLDVVHKGTPVVFGFYETQQLPETTLYTIARTNDSLGFVNLIADEDDFIRQALLASGREGEPRSFAAQLAASATGKTFRSEGGWLWWENHRLAEESRPVIRINFGPQDSVSTVSFVDVLKAFDAGRTEALKEVLGGRIVIVGSDDVQDRHSTPLFSPWNKQRTRGCEIHAWTVATLLDGRPIRDAAPGVRFACVLMVAAFAVTLCLRLAWWRGLAVCLALLPALGAAAGILFSQRLWLPPWAPFIAIAIAQSGSFVYRYRVELRERWRVRRLFESFVSREVLADILKQGAVPLGGKRQRITILISDVRQYTTWAEQNSPEDVVSQLNEYFGAMSEVIMRHRGFVDKFIGDGILALFGAPIADQEHAWNAVKAGQEMLRVLSVLNQRWAAQQRAEFRIGIGVHTGEAVVGTIGSEKKLEYTALGDSVNAAARIESHTKELDPPLLISGATLRAIGDRPLPVKDTGETDLRGRTEALRLFQVLSEAAPEPAALHVAGGTNR